jgi:hypothetical protein
MQIKDLGISHPVLFQYDLEIEKEAKRSIATNSIIQKNNTETKVNIEQTQLPQKKYLRRTRNNLSNC